MRFQQPASPPPYLNRKDQYRLLGLCAMLLIVMLAIREAARPETWNWIAGAPEQELTPVEDLEDISHLLEPGRGARNLAPDEFIAVQTAAPTDQPAAPPQQRLDVAPETLAALDDNHLGWKQGEVVALQAVLDHVRNLPSEALERTGAEELSYRVINTEPEQYRGRLVSLRGVLRRFEEFHQQGADESAPKAYVGWMFTDDSGNHPWMILCTESSPNLSIASSMETPVTVSGYFLKRFGYATTEGATLAPLIVTQRFHSVPTIAQDREQTENITTYVVAVLGAISLVFGGMLWMFIRSDRKFAGSHLAELARAAHEPQPADLEAIAQLQAIDPAHAFESFTPPDVDCVTESKTS
ncbi:MAG: hypothetical protein KDA58_10085 [Planctomycetaceae bacterium]|nr:hypothetical protein [Planctomycetaceae bacterium]